MTRATRNAAMVRTYGRNSWLARPGYQDRPRVPGPIQPMQAPKRGWFARIFGGTR